MAAAAALAEVNQSFQWIGFQAWNHRDRIIEKAGFMLLSPFVDVNHLQQARPQVDPWNPTLGVR